MEKLLTRNVQDLLKAKYLLFTLLVGVFIYEASIQVHLKQPWLSFGSILSWCVFFVFGRFYYIALRDKNYSFWGLSLLFLLYLLSTFFEVTRVDPNFSIYVLFFLIVGFTFFLIYLMSSPLFYPRTQWWEYDFRYRADLDGQLELESACYPIRLSDVRRGALCVESFEALALEKQVVIKSDVDDKLITVLGSIISARQEIEGRPFKYGVKVVLGTDKQKKDYQYLKDYWIKTKMGKLKNKFDNNGK